MGFAHAKEPAAAAAAAHCFVAAPPGGGVEDAPLVTVSADKAPGFVVAAVAADVRVLPLLCWAELASSDAAQSVMDELLRLSAA